MTGERGLNGCGCKHRGDAVTIEGVETMRADDVDEKAVGVDGAFPLAT